LTEQKLNLWIIGKLRSNVEFANIITRAWSALFIKELIKDPENFERYCREFGFDRAMATELCATFTSRCGNLKNFCNVSTAFVMARYTLPGLL
jgi:hypothetical protein